VPAPGPQNGRYASEPAGGLTSLAAHAEGRPPHNASVALALDKRDTIKRIDGSEEPLYTPWRDLSHEKGDAESDPAGPVLAPERPADETGIDRREAPVQGRGKPATGEPAPQEKLVPEPPTEPGAVAPGTEPPRLDSPRDDAADDLKRIKGVGPKLEKLLNSLGIFHFSQIAEWSEDEIAWVDYHLEGFQGRVLRDAWVEQARLLAAGGETDFSARAKKGDV
jgi:NADH-quinone oxidoreductase subunit E